MTEEIIARLRSLDLSDGGSHSRLSAIASCFLEPAYGWTRGACETLRDMLIDTLEDKDGNDNNDNSDGCNCTHHRCDQHGRQVSYDDLGNERHKAVCRLRNMQMDTGNAIKKLAVALGLEWNPNNAPKSVALLQSRIIHLLGGDEPNFTEIAKTINLGDKSDGELMENCENHKIASITDELRKWASDHTIKEMVLTTYPGQHGVHGILEQLIAIADRIDEQFDRICEQNEAVLQHTIDTMVDERDELQEKCDRLKTKVEHQREQLAVYATTYDFDAIRVLKRERNEHKHRADNAEGHVKSLERRLDAAHETYCALLNDAAREFRALTEERDELQAKLDDYDKTHVELPKDANGEYIHIGDMMDGYAKTIEVVELRYGRSGWMLISRDGNGYADTFAFAHHHAPTIEQVIRDLTMGKITESQAVERIEGINGQG